MLTYIKLILLNTKNKPLKVNLEPHKLDKSLKEKFADFHENQFKKLLELLQQERLKRLKRTKLYTSFAALFGIIAFFAIQKFFITDINKLPPTYQLLFFLTVVLTLAFLCRKSKQHYWKYYDLIKYNLINSLVKFFGDFTYYSKVKKHSSHLDFRKYEILPKCDFSHAEDYLIGEYKDTPISVMELELHNILPQEEQRRSFATTIIRAIQKQRLSVPDNILTEVVSAGIAVEIKIKKKFSGKTIIVKDRGKILNFMHDISKGYERAALEDPVFEKKFEVFTDNQTESRYLLTPSFMQRLLDLSSYYNNSPIEACFHQQHLFLFIPIKKNLFDYKRLVSQKDIEKFSQKSLNELIDIFKIIDVLHLDRKI